MRKFLATAIATAAVFATGCSHAAMQEAGLDRGQLLEDLRILAADDMQGRQTGTPGAARARAYIVGRLQETGAGPAGDSYEHGFTFTPRGAESEIAGTNILAFIDGVSDSDRVMVVSAHYDHEGMRDGQIWNGADDNASGVAALLAIAEDFAANPPQHDIILAFLDAEEMGLRGARAFVAGPPVAQERIAFNLNLDMLAMSEEGLLWVVGTYHYPFLVPLVEEVAGRAEVTMPMGYDEPTDVPGGDWTLLTDSGAFHRAGIPFIYLGVDFHPHYHQPTDTYENMTLDFFQDASAAALDFARQADERLDEIGEAAGR
jgi:hypothetical protein